MQIKNVGMTRNHFQPGSGTERVRMVVVHSTAGKAPGDYNWLRQGGSDKYPVSIHYYIDKAGNISQMVEDKNIAWHAGRSSWTVDGKAVNGCNPISIGIELENRNSGRDPYPQAQYDATLALVRELVAKYNIPRRQLVRHLDISPGRKTDPAGFAWERFVAQVYAPPAEPTPAPQPQPEPLQPSHQLRKLLVDLAYRAAGSAYPSGWPLLKETVSRETGMPILVITSTETVGDGEAEDDQARAVTLPGQTPLVIEAYGRDLFYAPPDQLGQIQRLSTTPAGPLRDALLDALFKAVDPVKGFKPNQAFHRFFLDHITQIGVPIGPDHILTDKISDGKTYSCQHYAMDTLCWNGSAIIRLSDLTRDMYGADPHQPWEKELRTAILNDLYTARTGRNFDRNALFCRYAIVHQLGAPLAKAEVEVLEGQRLVAMPFALDVLYARIPSDGNWKNVVVGELPGVLGEEDDVARLSTLLAQGDLDEAAPAVLGEGERIEDVLPQRIYTGGVLGIESLAPAIIDLTQSVAAIGHRGDTAVDIIAIYPTIGPASDDLQEVGLPGATLWHYYIDQTGVLIRLLDEHQLPRAAGDARWQAQGNIDQRSLAIAIEGGAAGLSPDQHSALAWLLNDLSKRYGFTGDQIIQGADLGLSQPIVGWDQIKRRN